MVHDPAPFLSFEAVHWIHTWREGAFFKVINADFESDGAHVSCREPLFRKQFSRSGPYSVMPVSLREDPHVWSEPLVGEHVTIPFKNQQRGMELLLRELST